MGITIGPVGTPDGNIWFTEIQGNKVRRLNLLAADGPPLSLTTRQTFSGEQKGDAGRSSFQKLSCVPNGTSS
jgi:hypothetical protein